MGTVDGFMQTTSFWVSLPHVAKNTHFSMSHRGTWHIFCRFSCFFSLALFGLARTLAKHAQLGHVILKRIFGEIFDVHMVVGTILLVEHF